MKRKTFHRKESILGEKHCHKKTTHNPCQHLAGKKSFETSFSMIKLMRTAFISMNESEVQYLFRTHKEIIIIACCCFPQTPGQEASPQVNTPIEALAVRHHKTEAPRKQASNHILGILESQFSQKTLLTGQHLHYSVFRTLCSFSSYED